MGSHSWSYDDEPGEAPLGNVLSESEWIETLAERERTEEKSETTAIEFWRVVLGGLHSEYVDRFDEQGYHGLSRND